MSDGVVQFKIDGVEYKSPLRCGWCHEIIQVGYELRHFGHCVHDAAQQKMTENTVLHDAVQQGLADGQ